MAMDELRDVQVVSLRIGPISQQLTPGYSFCHHCRTTWPFVEHHRTPYSAHGACFPLCELCWLELETPERRLPYYRQLWDEWVQSGEDDQDKWQAIEAAVKKGL